MGETMSGVSGASLGFGVGSIGGGLSVETGFAATAVAVEAPTVNTSVNLGSFVKLNGDLGPAPMSDFAMPSPVGNPFADLTPYSPLDMGVDNPGMRMENASLIGQAEAIAQNAWNSSKTPLGLEVSSPSLVSSQTLETQAQAVGQYIAKYMIRVSPVSVPEIVVTVNSEVPVNLPEEGVVAQQSFLSGEVVQPVTEQLVFIPDISQGEQVPLGVVQDSIEEVSRVEGDILTEPVVHMGEEIMSQSSDSAIAERVISLAQEVRPDLVPEIERTVAEKQKGTDVLASVQAEAINLEKTKVIDEENQSGDAMSEVSTGANNIPQTRRQGNGQRLPKPKPDEPEKFRIAQNETSERQRLLQDMIASEVDAAKKEERASQATVIADSFEQKAQKSRNARSPLLQQEGLDQRLDGGIEELAKEVRQTYDISSLGVADLTAKHPAVIRAALGKEALDRHVDETLYGSRRYASLAA